MCSNIFRLQWNCFTCGSPHVLTLLAIWDTVSTFSKRYETVGSWNPKRLFTSVIVLACDSIISKVISGSIKVNTTEFCPSVLCRVQTGSTARLNLELILPCWIFCLSSMTCHEILGTEKTYSKRTSEIICSTWTILNSLRNCNIVFRSPYLWFELHRQSLKIVVYFDMAQK